MVIGSKPNFFLELADYYQTQADKLELAWKTASIYENLQTL